MIDARDSNKFVSHNQGRALVSGTAHSKRGIVIGNGTLRGILRRLRRSRTGRTLSHGRWLVPEHHFWLTTTTSAAAAERPMRRMLCLRWPGNRAQSPWLKRTFRFGKLSSIVPSNTKISSSPACSRSLSLPKSESGLSTLVEFENEKRTPRRSTLTAIVAALEKAGVVFEHDGNYVGVKLRVRRRK